MTSRFQMLHFISFSLSPFLLFFIVSEVYLQISNTVTLAT